MTQSRAKPASPRRVLIVKPSSLGDVVTAMPLLRGLRRTFGDIHIAWLIGKTALPLIAHDTDVNDCVIFDRKTLGRAWRSPGASRKLKAFVGQLKRGRYDWAIDAQGLLRSALLARATRAEVRAGFAEAREGSTLFYTHRVSVDRESHTVDRNIALARALGIDARPEDMTLQVSHDAQEFANEFVDQNIMCSWSGSMSASLSEARVIGRYIPRIMADSSPAGTAERALCPPNGSR